MKKGKSQMSVSWRRVCRALLVASLTLHSWAQQNVSEPADQLLRIEAEGVLPTGAIIMSGIWDSFGHLVIVVVLVVISGLYAGRSFPAATRAVVVISNSGE